ncbi:hypothetical protein BKA64DRAFT_713228 [Cadophora sp. MPI-SDFR-AT-0126]|nr:hypothetical protein BKA64DRAFT_713228 [Leotiomycetes sp. MPI-SDFR-AT-0126]
MAVCSSATALPPSDSTSRSRHIIQLPIFREMNQYVAEIGVVTPPQKINMTADVGSASTWLLAPEATNQATGQRFNHSASTTTNLTR